MDILVYLLILGAGLAAAPGGDDHAAPSAYSQQESQPEDPADEDIASDDVVDGPEDLDGWMQGVDVGALTLPEAVEVPEGAADAAEADQEMAAAPEPAPERPPQTFSAAPVEAAPAPDGASGLAAEDQTATGRMTTATEIRPILTAIKPNWIAVRRWEGQDILYFTNLLGWRCGLVQISYAVNGGPEQVLAVEPCHDAGPVPNAMISQDFLPYVTLPEGSVQQVHVAVVYDDLGADGADYDRAGIEID